MKIRNPFLNADGSINCEIDHPVFGWIPFTARDDDVEAHGREIFGLASAMNPPPAPPAPVIVPSLSFAQLLIGLVSEGWITETEGNGWITGTLPPAVNAVIDTLPAEQRFPARARALRPSVVLRSDPLVPALGAAAGKTSAQIDAFFVTYAGV